MKPNPNPKVTKALTEFNDSVMKAWALFGTRADDWTESGPMEDHANLIDELADRLSDTLRRTAQNEEFSSIFKDVTGL